MTWLQPGESRLKILDLTMVVLTIALLCSIHNKRNREKMCWHSRLELTTYNALNKELHSQCLSGVLEKEDCLWSIQHAHNYCTFERRFQVN